MAEGDPNVAVAHCPTCGAEYRAGFDTCADDGTELVPGPTRAQDAKERASDAWTEATDRVWNKPRTDSEEHPVPVELCELQQVDAHLLAGRLEEAGIEVDVLDGETKWMSSSAFPSRVFVNEDQLEEARAIYKEFGERQGYEA